MAKQRMVSAITINIAYSDNSTEEWEVDVANGGNVTMEQDLETTRQELMMDVDKVFMPTHYRNITIEVTNARQVTMTTGKVEPELQIKLDSEKLAKVIEQAITPSQIMEVSNVNLDAEPPEDFQKRFGLGKYANKS